MDTMLVALLVALVAQPPLLALLRRADVFDHPSQRSSHLRPTLRGGGLAVVLAMLVAAVVGVRSGLVGAGAVLPAAIAVAGLGVLGFLEDVRGVPPMWRLVGQASAGAAAGAAAIAAGSPVWVAAVMAAAVVVYANAFNFMDGVNGISGLNAAFAGLAYAAIGARFGAVDVTIVGLAVAGASIGFLPFNFPVARVFLGDSGSYALGGVLAVLAVQTLGAGAPLLLCVAPMSVYLADTGWTLVARARHGASLAVAHREHAYQRLADSAAGHVVAAGSTVGVAALMTAVASMPRDAGGNPLVIGALGAFILAAYFVIPVTLNPSVISRNAAQPEVPAEEQSVSLAPSTEVSPVAVPRSTRFRVSVGTPQ